jgi:hypothetical protein
MVREREEEEKKRHGFKARMMKRRRVRSSIRSRAPTMLSSIAIVVALPLRTNCLAFGVCEKVATALKWSHFFLYYFYSKTKHYSISVLHRFNQ